MASFVTDLVALFTPVAAQIASERVTLGLPALKAPSPVAAGQVGALMIGQEWLRAEQSAPRIVIVPMGARYEAARRPGVQPLVAGAIGQLQPKVRELRWLAIGAAAFFGILGGFLLAALMTWLFGRF